MGWTGFYAREDCLVEREVSGAEKVGEKREREYPAIENLRGAASTEKGEGEETAKGKCL